MKVMIEGLEHEGEWAHFDIGEREAREACGVYAVYEPGKNVANLAYLGLLTMQNRGQEAAGISVLDYGGDGKTIVTEKDTGLVREVFRGGERLNGLPSGDYAIGQVRYGTVLGDGYKSAQPATHSGSKGELALGHNGNLTNTAELAAEYGFSADECASDSDVLTCAIGKAWEKNPDFKSALNEVLPKVKGAFSLVLLTEEGAFAARDTLGMRPLMIGKSAAGGYVVASERAALKVSGTEFVRDVQQGEAIHINAEGIDAWQWAEPEKSKLCSFEFVYFSRPDNVLGTETVKSVRERMGSLLAARWPVPHADIVMGVPESGTQAALGFSHASRIPYDQGFVKNPYMGRTFIYPTQEQREAAVDLKVTVLEEVVADRILVVVDDSIVRGTTTRRLVALARQAGAREVHLRISSARYMWPCFFGMDTGRRDELLAANMSHEEMNAHLGADSLGFLLPEDIRKAAGSMAGKLCLACMTGDYPIPINLKTAS